MGGRGRQIRAKNPAVEQTRLTPLLRVIAAAKKIRDELMMVGMKRDWWEESILSADQTGSICQPIPLSCGRENSSSGDISNHIGS